MVDRRLLATLAIASITVFAALALHSCSGDSPVPADTDTGSGDIDSRDDLLPNDSIGVDSDATFDADVLTDSGPRHGDGWFDGEYCPSSAFPPRKDGCPCQMYGGCDTSKLGKQCDYFQNCPPGPGLRITCKWIRPMEGEPYLDWEGSGIPCPPIENDAAAGD